MTQHRYSLAYNFICGVQIFVPVLQVRINTEYVNIHPDFLFNCHCQKSIYCNEIKTVSRISIFVNAISSIIEILQSTVKMACKMTFNDYYRF